MSQPSTPNNRHDATTPPKAPGTLSKILGMFSSKKEPRAQSVGPSTNDTGAMNGGFSPASFIGGASAMSAGRDSTANHSEMDDFQSPMSSGNGATMGASFAIGTSPSRGGQRTPSRLQYSSVLSSRKSDVNAQAPNRLSFVTDGDQSAFRNGKSPWKNRAVVTTVTTTNEPSVWQGSRSQFNGGATAAGPNTLSFLSNNTTERTRRYRPNSSLLTGSKGGQRFRNRGKLDNEKFGQALSNVRDMFMSSADDNNQDTSTNIFSTRGGMRWGDLDRPSRFTTKIQKRQRPAQQMRAADDDDADDYDEGDSRRKRRKKVSFDQERENASVSFTTNISGTPHRSNTGFSRKATPMPARTGHVSFESPPAASNEDEDEERSVPSAQRTDRLPSPPARFDFDFGALDSEDPSTLELPSCAMKTYDAVVPDPEVSSLTFNFNLKSKPTARGLVSTESHAEYEEKRYERPASPVHRRASRALDDNGGDNDQTEQQAQKRSKKSESQGTDVIPDWVCTKCNTKNNNDETVCQKKGCGNVRTSSGTSLGWGTLLSDLNKGKWKCQECKSMVDDKSDKCLSCEAEKPADANSTQSNTASASNNNAGSGAATPSSGSKFTFAAPTPGSAAAPSTGGFTFAAPPSSSTPTANAFGSSTGTGAGGFVFKAPESSSKDEKKEEASSKPSFGFTATSSSSTPASSTQTGGFSFGGTTVPSSSADNSSSVKAPAPAFGSNGNLNSGTPKTSSLSADAKPFESKPVGENGDKKPSSDTTGDNGATGTTPGFSFTGSTLASTPAQSTGGFQFGSSSATSKTPSDPPAASSSQGSSSFASQFTASSSKESKPADAAGGMSFGSSSGNAAATSSGTGGFSGQFASAPVSEQKPKRQRGYDLDGDNKPKASKTPPQAAPTLFGAPAAASGTTPASGGTFQFGSSSTTKDTNTENGSGNASATQFGNAAGGSTQFGGPSADSASASKPLFTFGGAPSSEAPAPSAPGGFGAPSGTPAPAFGSSASGPTSFGTAPAAPSAPAAVNFGSTPAPAAAGFGSAPTPAGSGFGSTPAPGGSGFGSTPAPGGSGFGSTPAPAGGSGFGSTPAPGGSGFGSTPAPAGGSGFGSTPAPAGGSGFGSTPAPAVPGFGAAPAPGGAGFGATPAPGATTFGATPAPAAAFGFGGAASTGFGSANPPAATTPAVPSFGGAPGFGAQTPAAPSQGFSASAFGSNAAPTTGGFGATPGPPGGFGAAPGFAAPQTGGFQQSTPAPGGFGGGGFGGATAPNTAPPGAGFNIGSSDARPRRRMVRAKRPTSTRKA